MPRLLPLAAMMACLAAPLLAQDDALCSASAYNFDVALTMKDQGFSEAETLANLQGMFDGVQNAASRALPGVVRAAYRYRGAAGPQAEAAYLQACLTGG